MSEIIARYVPYLTVDWTENFNNNILESEWIKLNINGDMVEMKLAIHSRQQDSSEEFYIPLVIEMKPEFLPTKYNVCLKYKVIRTLSYIKEVSRDRNQVIFQIPFQKQLMIVDDGYYRIKVEFPTVRKHKILAEIDVDVTGPMKRALSNGKNADFTIKVDGKEIKVVKYLLATYSDVFEKMFEANLDETKNNEVTITDISYDVMYALVEFLYTTKIKFENFNFAMDVLIAADKYNVSTLKQICENYMAINLENENAVAVMEYAIKCKSISLLVSASRLVADASSEELSTMIN